MYTHQCLFVFIGLEDQLLGRVILTEKKELETEKTQLIADVTANNRKIKELEANLLHKLTTVEVYQFMLQEPCKLYINILISFAFRVP